MGGTSIDERGVIVALSDVSQAYYNENGINISDAIAFQEAHDGSLIGFLEHKRYRRMNYCYWMWMFWCMRQWKMSLR